jgi:hypothetical protein
MNKAGNSLCLRIPQHRKSRIATHPYRGIGTECLKYFPDLEKTPDQLERQTNAGKICPPVPPPAMMIRLLNLKI